MKPDSRVIKFIRDITPKVIDFYEWALSKQNTNEELKEKCAASLIKRIAPEKIETGIEIRIIPVSEARKRIEKITEVKAIEE